MPRRPRRRATRSR